MFSFRFSYSALKEWFIAEFVQCLKSFMPKRFPRKKNPLPVDNWEFSVSLKKKKRKGVYFTPVGLNP